jgi:hypothetical protein
VATSKKPEFTFKLFFGGVMIVFGLVLSAGGIQNVFFPGGDVTCDGKEMHSGDFCKDLSNGDESYTYDQRKSRQDNVTGGDIAQLVVGLLLLLGGGALVAYDFIRNPPRSPESPADKLDRENREWLRSIRADTRLSDRHYRAADNIIANRNNIIATRNPDAPQLPLTPQEIDAADQLVALGHAFKHKKPNAAGRISKSMQQSLYKPHYASGTEERPAWLRAVRADPKLSDRHILVAELIGGEWTRRDLVPKEFEMADELVALGYLTYGGKGAENDIEYLPRRFI